MMKRRQPGGQPGGDSALGWPSVTMDPETGLVTVTVGSGPATRVAVLDSDESRKLATALGAEAARIEETGLADLLDDPDL